MATRKKTSTSRAASKKAAAGSSRAPALPAAGGGLVIHGRGKPNPQLLKELRPTVIRAERTASELRKVIAGRG